MDPTPAEQQAGAKEGKACLGAVDQEHAVQLVNQFDRAGDALSSAGAVFGLVENVGLLLLHCEKAMKLQASVDATLQIHYSSP